LTPAYLDLLDGLLRSGLSAMGEAFSRLQADYVCAAQRPDGGFPGRRGTSDTYYTEFALRLLVALSPERTQPLRHAAEFLRYLPGRPRDVVQCFSLLNCRRLLAGVGLDVPVDSEALSAIVDAQRLPGGSYARPGGDGPSAYHTFLATLCRQMLRPEAPVSRDAVDAISGLQGPGGGFREQPTGELEQTNATAAAVGYLTMAEAIGREQSQRAAAFLLRMQAPDGGLRAHEKATGGDLLSAFTGMLTLAGLDSSHIPNLAAIARFVRATARPAGGFSASGLDPGTDIEYTYYGVGCLAILRSVAAASGVGRRN